MCIETGLSRALALNSARVAKIALFRYFKKNVRVKGLKIVSYSSLHLTTPQKGKLSIAT